MNLFLLSSQSLIFFFISQLHLGVFTKCFHKLFLLVCVFPFIILQYRWSIFIFFMSLHKPVAFYCFYFRHLSKNKLLLNQILKLFHRSIFYFVAFSIFYGFDISKGPLENISFLFLLCCIRCYLLAYFLSLHSMFSHINTF